MTGDTMTPRERLLAAIEFTGPDRCPIHHYIFPGALWRHGERLMELVERYPDDFGNANIKANLQRMPEGDETDEDVVEYEDAWGTVWRRLRGYTSGEVLRPAIPDWDAWEDYQFPSPPPDEHFEQFAASAKQRHPEEFVTAGGGGFFQLMQHMRGPANYFADLAQDHPGAHELADRMVEHNLYRIKRYLQADVDCITFGDDWGAQHRLLIHPDMWRRFFKPRYARMFEPIRDAGVHVWFHTDGWILEIIEDLIEIGVTVLNPQHPCMGTKRVGEICGGRVCIRTDIDRQWVIPFGTPLQVEEAVKEAIAAFGSFNGGCILHGEVGQEVPFENIQALYSAFYNYGRYPLEWLGG
ncbi:MAG: uroporphyrinogen decarboxylase family protein [Armatimonadota bacterium]|nr:uroporphyrinogen decarboxylase family protein [Armatimonadota bacterium]